MNWQEIREVAAQGVEFASHTLTHPRLTTISAERQKDEIACSKTALEDALGRHVSFFCYPHMDVDERAKEFVRDAGYSAACGGEQAENTRYLLHRIDVSQAGWPSTLFRIWGWRRALQKNRALRWLRQSLRPPPAINSGQMEVAP
jgi:peptidoglycan/xylan/chitin deacetylase (PgdA/CDA1 family)